MDSVNTFAVSSSKNDKVYKVTIRSVTCSDQPRCIAHCKEMECIYLCRHMVQCSCIDYVHGHLCKHAHKVQMNLYMYSGTHMSATQNVCFNQVKIMFNKTGSPQDQNIHTDAIHISDEMAISDEMDVGENCTVPAVSKVLTVGMLVYTQIICSSSATVLLCMY